MLKQIKAKELDKLIKHQIKGTLTDKNKVTISLNIDENKKIDIIVTPIISVEEMNSLVQSITNALFTDGSYIPSVENVVYVKAILAYFTNINIDELTNDMLVALIYKTDIMDKIYKAINKKQLDDIDNSLIKNISFKKEEIITAQTQRLNENVVKLEEYTNFISQLNNQMSNIDLSKLEKNISSFSKFSDKEFVDNIIENQSEKNNENKEK